ncbi:MAG TPA: hypothetical protein VF188_18285 [Longimicrobiales bacterium]
MEDEARTSHRVGVLDLAVGQREERDDLFLTWLRDACAARGLSFEVLHEGVVEEACGAVDGGDLRIRTLLDLTASWWHEDDPYVRLCYAVKDSGGRVIDDPDIAMMADHKAVSHHRLRQAGLPVPPTVVLRRWTPDRELTAAERAAVGEPVVIKPARGWGWKGVVLGARCDREAITRARDFDRGDDFLIQRQVPYAWLLDDQGVRRPAWWRTYYVFGEIIPCWWSPTDCVYRLASLREVWTHGLLPVARLTAEIARLTGMDFFSTEICMAEEPAAEGAAYHANGRPFYVIDYVNDQCDVRCQSQHPAGPPDDVVKHLAERFAEVAWRQRHELPQGAHRSLWLRRGPEGDPTV